MTDFEEDYPGQLLHQAAFYDNVELLQELLASSERLHINAANSSGQTALHSAVAGDSRESLQMLLQAGADPGIASGMRDNCRTPLHQAVSQSKVECVKVLVDGGASLEVKDGEGKTAYHLATALGNRKILDILKMEKEAQRKIKEIITADLYQACVDGRADKAAELISQLDREVINAAYNGGSTLLYRASQLGHESVVQLLLNSGADAVPNVGTGLTPLHAACWTGQVNIATLLLQHLPQFAGMDSSQSLQLPIHVAASQGHLDIVNVLLNTLDVKDTESVNSQSNLDTATFDINALDLNWHSSLHLAVLESRASVVEALLQWSARSHTTSVTESNPVSPRSPLEDLGQRITVDTYSVLGRTPLHDAVKNGDLAIVTLLLHHGADADLPAKVPSGSSPYNSLDSNSSFEGTSANMTALAEAASCGSKDIVVTLLKYGAKDTRDTALQSALTNGHTDIAGLLLSCSGVAIDLESKLNRRLQLFLERSCSVEEDNMKSMDSFTTLMSSEGTMASGNLGTGTLARTSTRNKAVRVNWCWRNLRKLNVAWFIEACVHLNHTLVPSKSALVCITRIDVSDNQIVQLPKEIFVDMDSLQQLNSCNNCISSLPEFKDDDPFNSPSLKEFDISGNRLSAIPTWIFQLPALEILNLSNNRLKGVPFSMWTAQKLTHLDISVNLLEELPSRTESESECAVQTTGSTSEEDRQRTETNSSKESNESFHTPNGSDGEREPDASSDVKAETSSLQRRESTNNLVQPWKPTNANCKRRKLDRINIWEKDVATSILTEEFASEVDEESSSTSALDFLNLAWNKLTAVPTGLPCLAPRLSKLDLSHNIISDAGPPNAYPKGLTKLLLQYNKIVDSKRYSRQDSESCCYSPYASSLRTSVSGASIADIRISRSESVLSQISFLSLLSLCHHRRHSILPGLKILDLSDNQIESLELVYSLEESRPPSVSDGAERISTKSHSTGDPAQRKRKRTSESSSSSLDQLTNLHPLYPKLSTLNVSNNKIKVIPADMGLYQDLTMLYVSDNKDIRTLPMELGKLEKLWDFRANGMELEEPLQGLQLRSTRHLIGYLRSILDQSRPYCRMKLMLVGLQGVGKTSLLHEMRREGTGSYQEVAIKGWASRMGYFRNDQKTRKGQNISTVGVDVGDWTYVKKVKKKPCELGEVTFSTWDFGGQREYYATHQYFLSKRSLYLACWKITDGEKGIEDLQQWLINIQARAPDSPVIIVGTHYDEFKKYPPSFLPELRDMIDSRFINLPEPHLHGLPRVKGQLEVSCKNHHNVRELCDFIYDTVFQLKVRGGTGQLLLKQPIPATYLALQKTVAQIAAQRKAGGKHPVLVGDQYKIEVMTEMMRKENLCFRDQEELKQATQFLHENGVLLHYEDVALKDLYFLDPQWLCDMLAHVITIPEINGYVKNGILETKCLSLIFKSAAITPVDIRLYIVDLLNKFEVALTWDNKNLLIPSLLPTEEKIKKSVAEGREVKITMKRKGKKSKAMVMKPSKDPHSTRRIHVSRPEKISAGKSTFYQGAAPSPLPAPPRKEDINGNSSCEERKNKVKVTYTDQFQRFYLMSYFPSGFWSRLITRVFADDHLYDTAAACFEAVTGDIGDGPVQVLMESPHWVCWQTGFKLRHCNVTLLTVKEVIGEEDERKKYSTLPLSTRDVPSMAGYHGGKLQISVPLSEVKYSYTHTVSTPTSISEEVQKKIVLKTDVAIATRLLAVVVDHLDLLLQDWYSDIGERFRQTSHGLYLVRRVIPCPKCQKAAVTTKQPKKKQRDVHHRGEAWEVVEVSPQDHEPYVSKTIVSPVDEKSKSTAKEKTMQATKNTDTTMPSSARNAEEEASEDLMFQLELSTEMKQGVDKVGGDAKNDNVAVREAASDVEKKEEYTEPKKPLSLAFVEPAKPDKGGSRLNVPEDQPGKQRKGKKSNAESGAITTFQFDDLVYQSLSQKTVDCPRHGTLLLKTLVPDVMFEDIATKLLLDPSEITTQRLLGTGAFGFVFQGLRKTRNALGTSVALKILEPRDPGKEAPDTAKKEYAQHKRKWTQEPTWAACKAYCTMRQEMMVLSSLTHPHIVSLLGVCHQPLCLVLELACRGALDTRLREYRREGVRLDPCLVQLIVVQISSAISYLHSHRIIYRDLKAQNVLVWSLPAPTDDPTCHVHVKLADYGISRAAMPRGEVKGYGGSPGYMAPEIVQHYGMEAYTEKVDCFSFAMFLYELLSLKQPFEGLDQINDLILREKRPPLTEKERSYPTNILDTMSLCWSHDPHNRPRAADIHKAARCPEFPLLLQAMPVADGPGKTALVACATYSEQFQVIDDGYGGLLEQSVTQVWLCNLAQNGPPTQVDILQVVDGRLQEEAMTFEVPDVVCRVCIIGDMIWMGIDKPVVHIYRLSTLEKLKTLSLSNNVRRTNTVRSILHIPDTRTVLVTLSLGTVVQYKYSGGDSNTQNSDPITVTEVHRARLEYHTFSAAIVNTVNRSTELWLGGCDGGMKIADGESLVVLKDLNHFDPRCSKVNVMHLATQGGPDRPGVGGNVWSFVYPGTIVYKWEVNTWYNTHKLECKDHLPSLDAGGCQVTCLQVQGDQLYVGTVWGHLLICDAAKMTCLAQVKGHIEDVKYIIPVSSGIQLAESLLQGTDQDTQSNKQQKSQLLTIGLGYNYLLQNHMEGSHVKQGRPSSESILLVWDADSWELAGQC